MRYYTYGVGAALVIELQIAGAVDQIIHDGRDIIHLRLITGEHLMIHLIDSSIPLYEIKNILTKNTAAGHYTLFILWCDMLLPDDGTRVKLQDWHEGFLAAHGGKIYAYKVYMQELFVFPVYFDAIPYMRERVVRYGRTVDLGGLVCGMVDTRLHGLAGTWRVANYGGDPDMYYRQRAQAQHHLMPDVLRAAYILLEVKPGADRATIKQAYRALARRYHPDLNPDSGSTKQMQEINQAYNRILVALGEDGA